MPESKRPQSQVPRSARLGAGKLGVGRRLAQLCCLVFGLIGLLPVVVGLSLRTEQVRARLAEETAAVLEQELGVTATYEVRVELLPLRLSLLNLSVPATDGGGPALTARSVRVSPRFFALIAGQLDAGDIEVDEPSARLVIKGGKLTNVAHRVPESPSDSAPLERAPFSSIAISGGQVELTLDDDHFESHGIDLDVYAEPGLAFELALRAAPTYITRRREPPPSGDEAPRVAPALAVDEDVACQLELRARYEDGELLIRRLALFGLMDADDAPGTRPSCAPPALEEDPRRVSVRLSSVRIKPRPSDVPLASGHVRVRAPVPPVNRYLGTELRGWVGVDGQFVLDGENPLPNFEGRVRGGQIGLGGYGFAKYLDAEVKIADGIITLPKSKAGYANGDVEMHDVRIAPLAKPPTISMRELEARNMNFPGLMRDLAVTEHTVCQWDQDKTRITDFKGTLSPLKLDATLHAETSNFEIFDRAYHDPSRRHMIGVRGPASVRARIAVRPNAFEFHDVRTEFGKSQLNASLVSLGFDSQFRVTVSKSTQLDLSDISPIVDIPIAGQAELDAKLVGTFGDPVLEGGLAVKGFEFGGFPLGDIEHAKTRFVPLVLELTDVRGKKGKSRFDAPSARLDFNGPATVLVDAEVRSSALGLRDFFAMWRFDQDPRFLGLDGTGEVSASVHFDVGGRRDRCGGGYLEVKGEGRFKDLQLFEERFERGAATFDFRWDDRDASYLGFELDVPSFSLQKGGGVMVGSLMLGRGGTIQAHGVGTRVPLPAFQSLGVLGTVVAGYASGTAEVHGTVDQLAFDASVVLSQVHLESTRLPDSVLDVTLRPVPRALQVIGRTRCGGAVTAPFSLARYQEDRAEGHFQVDGELFGGQIALQGLKISRQRSKHLEGAVVLRGLQVGSLAELMSVSGEPPKASLTGRLDIESLWLDRPREARAKLTLESLEVTQEGVRVALLPGAQPIQIASRSVQVPALSLGVSHGDARAVFDLSGSVSGLGANPTVELGLELRPLQLSELAAGLPQVERARGTLRGRLDVKGPLSQPVYGGGFSLTGGELSLTGMGNTLSNVELDVGVDSDQITIRQGSARVGTGRVKLSGDARLSGLSLGRARFVVAADNISLPVSSGVEATLDVALVASWDPQVLGPTGEPALPRVTGDVEVRSFRYSRPVVMSADLSSLASRGRRTDFESYDPADDRVQFDITLRASRALTLSNNLVDAELEVGRQGLLLSGTNQRFGVRGALRLKPGGRLRLRQSEFEIQQGAVRFDDLTRIAPRVDVTAVTEYRRYSDAGLTSSGESGAAASGAGHTGGRWAITLRAHGDAEQLKVDLTSNPALSQDDIFLLLTVGLTRAELDQAQSAGVGESMALEALGALTGADRAVTKVLPVIDEFNFGSSYSSRTGRTEPTVTIGKRLTERLRANVVSGLSDSGEVRSNVEWRLNRRVSVEGSYDNVNALGSSSLGNLGADIRWRLEFQ